METTNFGFVASLLFVGVPTIFLIGLFISTQDGEKSSFYSESSKKSKDSRYHPLESCFFFQNKNSCTEMQSIYESFSVLDQAYLY